MTNVVTLPSVGSNEEGIPATLDELARPQIFSMAGAPKRPLMEPQIFAARNPARPTWCMIPVPYVAGTGTA